jgi:PAS domain S-box-containing protein
VSQAPAQDEVDSLVESAPCGYVATGPDGGIVQVNAAFEAMTGYGREQLQGKKRFVDLLPVGDRIFHETHYLPTLHLHGQAREIAFALVRPDGVRVPVLVNAVLHTDVDGRPRVVRAMVFDASDRRRYEEELLRARRHEQHIAQRLQASLLAGAFPTDPRMQLSAFLRPADTDLAVGGDWHDAFWVAEQEVVGLVVGDVVGHGLEAAGTMGQQRRALRALGGTGVDPGGTLSALDAYARRHAVGRMSTVIYAQLHLGTRCLHFAVAGHPPPVVLVPGQAPRYDWQARAVPLDCAAAPAHRETATVQLEAGASVLLFSDGVVEDRSRSVDAGLDSLLEAVAAERDLPPAALTAHLAQSLGGARNTDDVCLLAAQLR